MKNEIENNFNSAELKEKPKTSFWQKPKFFLSILLGLVGLATVLTVILLSMNILRRENEPPTEVKEVVVTTDKKHYQEQALITATAQNNTNSDVFYSYTSWTLYKLKEGEWVSVPYPWIIPHVEPPYSLSRLKPGAKTLTSVTVNMLSSVLKSDSHDGRYRLEFKYSYDSDDNREIFKSFSKEFEIDGNLVKELTFEKTFGGKKDDYGGSIIQAGDGGYVITGQKNYLDCLLMKIDYNGNKEWEKTFGDENYRYLGNSILRTSDGGYIIAGVGNFIAAAARATHSRVLLIKTDSSGNEEWRKLFENASRTNIGNSIIEDPDGGYIIGSLAGDFNLIKTDATGNLEWGEDFGFGGLRSFIQLSDRSYVLIGTNWNYSEGKHSNARLLKVSSDGSKEWEKVFSATGGDALMQSRDDGFVLMGSIAYSDKNKGRGQEIWLAKTDRNGNKEWENTYSVYDYNRGRSLIRSQDGGYMIVGSTRFLDMEKSANDAVLIKVDNKGNEEWKRTFGGDGENVFNSAIQVEDGGYVVLGTTKESSARKRDIWLIKTDSQGRVYK